MRLLIQRTIETGQERLSPLSEEEPDILAQLWPLVREAIKSGQRVHVGAGWWCRATVEQEQGWKQTCFRGRRGRHWWPWRSRL